MTMPKRKARQAARNKRLRRTESEKHLVSQTFKTNCENNDTSFSHGEKERRSICGCNDIVDDIRCTTSLADTNEVSDDDDELPCPLLIKESVADKKFQPNDIVWAKYKDLYWPAVVLRVDYHRKKIKVMFVDAPDLENSIYLSLSNVLFYDCEKCNSFKLQQPSNANDLEKLTSAISCVESFLLKRILKGNKTPASEYFKCPFVYSVIEKNDVGEELCDDDDDDDVDVNEKINSETPPDNEKDGGGGGGGSSGDNLPARVSSSDQKLISNKDHCQRLIEWIKSEKCKEYLIKIFLGKTASDRQAKFFSPVASQRNKLKFKAGFGPVENEAQTDDIVNYLKDLLKQELPNYQDVSAVYYIFDVWAPEAIIWAIRQEFSVSKRKAENLFLNGRCLMDKFNKLKM